MLTQSDEEFFLQSFIFTGLPFFGNQMLSHVIRRISAVVAYQFESESKKIVFFSSSSESTRFRIQTTTKHSTKFRSWIRFTIAKTKKTLTNFGRSKFTFPLYRFAFIKFYNKPSWSVFELLRSTLDDEKDIRTLSTKSIIHIVLDALKNMKKVHHNNVCRRTDVRITIEFFFWWQNKNWDFGNEAKKERIWINVRNSIL